MTEIRILGDHSVVIDDMVFPLITKDLVWKTFNARDHLTHNDLVQLGRIAEAYHFLMLKTQKNRNYVCKYIKQAMQEIREV